MITIFSTPKDFSGEFDLIQKNALSSWRNISDEIEIIILGRSKGAKAAAMAIDALYIPDIPLSDQGTPTIPGLFKFSENNGMHNVFCFLNSDIILPPDFFSSIQTVHSHFGKFLAIGFRYNIDVQSTIDFSIKSKSQEFFIRAEQKAVKESSSAIDLFCFSKGLFKNIPEFAVGRPGFDNWLIWKARRTFTPVIDITNDAKIYHQNHSYNFRGFQSHSDILNSKEAKINNKLIGSNSLTLNDANWFLLKGKVIKKRDNEFVQRNLWKRSIIFHEFSFFLILYKRIYRRIAKMFC